MLAFPEARGSPRRGRAGPAALLASLVADAAVKVEVEVEEAKMGAVLVHLCERGVEG